MSDEATGMWETRAIDLQVHLPAAVAAEVEAVQKRDPELMSKIVLYVVTRRAIFDHLATRTAFGMRQDEP